VILSGTGNKFKTLGKPITLEVDSFRSIRNDKKQIPGFADDVIGNCLTQIIIGISKIRKHQKYGKKDF